MYGPEEQEVEPDPIEQLGIDMEDACGPSYEDDDDNGSDDNQEDDED